MYEDYHCLLYLLQSVCMSCVTKCDYQQNVTKCTKIITVFYICYKVFVCPVCYEDDQLLYLS